MRLNIVAFALGVWLLQQQPAVSSLGGAVLLAVPALAWMLIRRFGPKRTVQASRPAVAREKHPVARGDPVSTEGRDDRTVASAALPVYKGQQYSMLLVAAVFAFGSGFYWAALRADGRLADALPVEWEGRDIEVEGTVASLPQRYPGSTRFEFDVERIATEGAAVPRRIALTQWSSGANREHAAMLPRIAAGERWRLVVRLRRPHGAANPAGFDYEAWLLERNVRATGYVRVDDRNRRLSAMGHAARYWVEAAREAIRARIERTLQGAPYGGVISALAIGDQQAISPAQWQVFTRTGVNHLMSISGLHVTMVSGLVFALASTLWRRNARLTLWLPARKAGALFGVAAALVYALLAGFAIPAQRTLYMLAVAAVALCAGLPHSVSTVLAAALFVVLVLDPWAVLAPGFWLSFGAVGIIMYVTVSRMTRPHWLENWGRVQSAVTLGLIAPLIALFQQASIVSPVANAIAIPVVSLVVVPLTLIGAVSPFDVPLHAAHFVMRACMLPLEWLSALPAAVWQQHASPAWAVLVAAVGAAWLMLPRGFPARALGAVGFLPLFLAPSPQVDPGAFKLTVLDVGQGLAVLVQTQHHALLYDAGPAYGAGADSGNRIVVPYLRASGVRALDGVILTHDDLNHTGGASSVLQALPVRWLLTSVADADALPLGATGARACHAGEQWMWDGVTFEVLSPAEESYADFRMKENDRSCVLRIRTARASALLPGDIEGRTERALVAKSGPALAADVLLAPHEGSKTSSTPAFVEAVKPKIAVFSVGYRNRFRHPHEAVLERYRGVGSEIHRTDHHGAITLFIGASGSIRVERYRATHARYWNMR